jgi:hypothetical protein
LLEVDVRHIRQQHARVGLQAQHAADGNRHLPGCEARHRHLIEQRLEEMVILAVEQRDAHGGASQRARHAEAAETSTHHQHVAPQFHAPVLVPPAVNPKPGSPRLTARGERRGEPDPTSYSEALADAHLCVPRQSCRGKVLESTAVIPPSASLATRSLRTRRWTSTIREAGRRVTCGRTWMEG